MKRSDLTVIKGGREDKYTYISGYVTDTRLMGVMCMCINWLLNSEDEIHQYFYFETEEYGFDDYESVMNFDVQAMSLIEMQMAGNLGGRKIDITEDEALYLFNKYADFNQEHDIPLPEGKEEYSFMMGRGKKLNKEEIKKLEKKICCTITNRYETINYFLMRCFGLDFEGAGILTEGELDLDVFKEFGISVLCKNTIDATKAEDIYRCESIIERNGRYMIVVCEVGVRDMLIDGFEILSSMKISDFEATRILAKSEFVTVYETLTDQARVENIIISVARSSAVMPFETGNCYTEYNMTNEHVKKRVYWLNEDIRGVYFVMASGMLVICAYHVLFEFMQSGYDDFQEYIKDMTGGEIT